MRIPFFFSQLVRPILASCGNENQVNTNGFTPQRGSEIFNSIQNNNTLTYLSALIQQTNCPSAGGYLKLGFERTHITLSEIV